MNRIKVIPTHPKFIMPNKPHDSDSGYDIFMVEDGVCGKYYRQEMITLGFSLEMPPGIEAWILPRSGVGFNFQIEINNTLGLIDNGYLDTIYAKIRTKDGGTYKWKAGERLLQMVFKEVLPTELYEGDSVAVTDRGRTGLGGTGK